MPNTMRAVVKPARQPGAELRDVPVPEPGPDDVLIKVRAVSICGTDLHIYKWDTLMDETFGETPMVFGHEYCGDVVEVGRNVRRVKAGDFVSGETHIACGRCYLCRTGQQHICPNTELVGVMRPGCFAELVSIPEDNVWVNPPDMPVEIATIQEPFGNAVQTVLSGEIAGRSMLVMGCGPIGLFAVAIAKASGAAPIWAVDVNDYRLDLARQLGATRAINSREEDPVAIIRSETEGAGCDVALEMSGAPVGIRQAFEALRPGGRISILGLPSEPMEFDLSNLIVLKAAEVHGIYGRKMYETWYQTRALLGHGLVDVTPLITHRMSLEDFEEGIHLLMGGEAGKIILTVNE
jgi:threonine 3-dehydrogenase